MRVFSPVLNLHRGTEKDAKPDTPRTPVPGVSGTERGWKRCACLTYVSGTLPQVQKKIDRRVPSQKLAT